MLAGHSGSFRRNTLWVLLLLAAVLLPASNGIECNAGVPVQQVKQGFPTNLTGLSIFHDDATTELELAIQATTGYVRLLNLDGLLLLGYGEDRRILVRGKLGALQEALKNVEYSSCSECFADLDVLRISCSLPAQRVGHQTFAGGFQFESQLRIQVSLLPASPAVRADYQHREVDEDGVLLLRDLRVEYGRPGAVLKLNITASDGRVAVQHDWFAPFATLTGTVAELNSQLKTFGVTFQERSFHANCLSLVAPTKLTVDTSWFYPKTDLEISEAEGKKASEKLFFVATFTAGLHRVTVAPEARSCSDAPGMDDTCATSVIQLEHSLGLTRDQLFIEDFDHCCTAVSFTNDASLAMVAFVRNTHVSITLSPYASQAPCEWSTAA
ncbi:unnamed protein product [Polarella glacialis]|uniref:Uncharacterized protein n=1 Tax=Polarella glacialis TaxID=89957 RepID=A0A813GXW4_POLGL|nr:unnamed protein product [Polarella glacialis]